MYIKYFILLYGFFFGFIGIICGTIISYNEVSQKIILNRELYSTYEKIVEYINAFSKNIITFGFIFFILSYLLPIIFIIIIIYKSIKFIKKNL